MKKWLKRIFEALFSPIQKRTIDILLNGVEQNRILIAGLYLRSMHHDGEDGKLSSNEFKVFSQSGEDGIIQYLLSKVPIENEVFVEFGVEDYLESNTRFLLMNNNWRGLVIDGDKENIKRIKQSFLYWVHDITAVKAFITRDNINEIIESNGISGDIGLLSVDVDGNDYWIWEKIDVISPRIVVCEYNNLFGPVEPVSIPYSDNFVRTRAHYSRLYFGASLKAFCTLAERKGYHFMGCNSDGVNAFFVRKDVAGSLVPVSCESGYVKSKVRESLDEKGRLSHVSGDDRIKLIQEMPVVDVLTKNEKRIKELQLS